MKICFATNNTHKIEEVKAILEENFQLVSLRELGYTGDLREDYDTLEENADQKASFVYNQFQASCFADDSGLEVFALGNEPGVKSARYAGDHRNDHDNTSLLLKNLANKASRRARFRTIISLIIDAETHHFEGIVEGTIADSPRGNNGFGYDPIFIPDGYDKTFAELDMAEKNKISHRARAVKKLADYLNSAFRA
jgi:XTP/dITP diphosphohydrolase